MARPLIILDRDGVVNHDSPLYVRSAEAWTPIDGAIEAIATMCRAGYDVVIATNQAGVAKGLIPVAELDQMHRKLEALVDAAGGQIARIYDCRHHPDHGCGCRKPEPGMLLKACLDFGQPRGGLFRGRCAHRHGGGRACGLPACAGSDRERAGDTGAGRIRPDDTGSRLVGRGAGMAGEAW